MCIIGGGTDIYEQVGGGADILEGQGETDIHKRGGHTLKRGTEILKEKGSFKNFALGVLVYALGVLV